MKDSLGAFVTDRPVRIRGAETGLLAGLEFAAKDVFDIEGHRSGFGNPDWLRTHPPATATASAVQKLVEAGATLVGKVHTDELTFSMNGENHHYGTPVNANAPGRIPGGSSSGSASAVAGELVDFALGTDTGGSVRIPASNCGIYGIRPTHGRVSNDHVLPLAASYDTVGWFTRDAALLERVGQVLLGEDQSEPGSPRLLLVADAFELASDRARPALESAARRVSEELGPAQEISLFNDDAYNWMHNFRIIQCREVWRTHGEWIRATQPALGPDIRARLEWAAALGPEVEPDALTFRSRVTRQLDELLGHDGVLCLPTSPDIALRRNTDGEKLEAFRKTALTLLCPAGLAGLPQVTLPLATSQSCPLGISLIGPRGRDRWLLDLAARISP